MSMTQEMIKQNVFNWLDALVVGAKAFNTEIVCDDVPEREQWSVTARTYENYMTDDFPTVNIHSIDVVAKAAEIDLQHRDFTPADSYYTYFTGEDFFIYNGVKFSDMVNGHFSEEEKEARNEARNKEEKENARKQNSDSGVHEKESVDNE